MAWSVVSKALFTLTTFWLIVADISSVISISTIDMEWFVWNPCFINNILENAGPRILVCNGQKHDYSQFTPMEINRPSLLKCWETPVCSISDSVVFFPNITSMSAQAVTVLSQNTIHILHYFYLYCHLLLTRVFIYKKQTDFPAISVLSQMRFSVTESIE